MYEETLSMAETGPPGWDSGRPGFGQSTVIPVSRSTGQPGNRAPQHPATVYALPGSMS